MAFLDNNGVTTLVTRLKNYFALKTDIPTVPTAYTSNPAMDGTASAGSGTSYARGNHVHPHDTSKQDKLVSGTNIKTINNESLLGSGDITITIPTKTTDLTNDAGFITSSAIANKANLSNGYVDDSQLLSAETLAKWQAILS